MARLRLPSVLVVAWLLLTPGALAWEQYRGGPDRNARVALPSGPLDVVALGHLPPGWMTRYANGAPSVTTPYGVVYFLLDEDATCALGLVEDAVALETRILPLDGCENGGQLLAYDREQDLLFVCVSGPAGSHHLRALRAADLQEAWSVSAAGFATPTHPFWHCQGGAFDGERSELVTIFYSLGDALVANDNRLVSIDVRSGTVNWASVIPADATPEQGAIEDAVALPQPGEGARTVTLTESGIVVMSVQMAPGGVANYAAMKMFDRSGALTHASRAIASDPAADGQLNAANIASHYAVARGALAMLIYSDRIVVANPELGEIVQSAPLEAADSSTEYIWYATGAWTADRLVVALPHSVSAYTPSALELAWTYTEGNEWEVREVVSSNRDETLVLMGRPDTGATQVLLLATSTGQLLQRTPLPLEAVGPVAWDGHVEVLPGEGVLLSTREGELAYLAESDGTLRPEAGASTLYPAIGEPIEISLSTPQPPRTILVRWGDGEPEEYAPGDVLRHAYARAGDATFSITAVYEDGRTGSTVGVVHVGATPPAELTTLQKAFSPEYQNWTFFVLGTFITVIGLAITVGRNRRRFSKLERELNAVEEIRMLSIADPRAAIVALKSYRDRLPEDLARRRIDDSQYHILDIRSARLLKVLRTRLFAPYDSRLTPRYHRLLEAAFEDAILQPSERETLVDALAHEAAIADAERAEIARILADFTSDRTDLRLA